MARMDAIIAPSFPCGSGDPGANARSSDACADMCDVATVLAFGRCAMKALSARSGERDGPIASWQWEGEVSCSSHRCATTRASLAHLTLPLLRHGSLTLLPQAGGEGLQWSEALQ